MTDPMQARIEQWLDERWRDEARCPAGHDEWQVAPTMAFMPGFAMTESGPKIVHENGFTFVVVSCARCGYVALLDSRAIAAG